jgi:hypothetical protein
VIEMIFTEINKIQNISTKPVEIGMEMKKKEW